MDDIFSVSEVVQIGVQIEINGRDFYNILVEKSSDEETKVLFKFLADEEEKHIRTFNKILYLIQKYEQAQDYPVEYFSQMNALASEHVFTQKGKGSEIAQNVKNDKEAIDLGIKFEQDSILFYEGIKKVIPQSEHRVLDSLISQEQNHLKKLTKIKEVL